jgi:hypothetical protein
MIFFSAIIKYIATPLLLMIYETKKSMLSNHFRFHSSLIPQSLIFSLRARFLSFSVYSKSKSYKNNSFLGDTKYSHRDNNFSLSPLITSLLFLVIVVPFQQALSAPQISIVWGTTTNASSSDVLKGFDGLPLSAGIQGNGDGDLVELGYFSEASTGNPFSGTWIPLTQKTRVGDSSSGYGFEDGMFIFTTNFFKDSDHVIVFPTEPKEYAEDIGFTITTSTPQAGTPICIRFYEEAYKGATKFNTVTGENWLWPPFPDGSSIPTNLYLKIASGAEPSGSSWRYGGTFEDNAPLNRFKTTIAPQYSIGIAISEYSNGTGSVIDINGSYEWGETIALTATPNEHSGFMGWIGSGIDQPSNQNTTLTVNGDQTVYAEFFAIPYELNLETSGEGTVSGSGVFTFGENVTISAFPSEGHSFVRWEKDSVEISTSPETSVTIEGKTDLVAIFSRNQYQVNIGASEGGSYEILAADGSNPSTYSHGFEYTLRALPDIHYGFNSWSSSSAGLSMIGNKVFAQTTFVPTSDVNFTAFFDELSYQLNIESTQGYKTLSASGNFPALSIVPIEVQPAEGFVFDYWLDPKGILTDPNAHQTEANISLIYPNQEASISAILRLNDYGETDVNISKEYGGNISLETDESGGFTHFKTYELNATAIKGYHFDQWIGDTEQLLSGPYLSKNKILIEGPLSLKASFKPTEYNINLNSIGDGDTVGPETFNITEFPTIKAIAFPGWRFTHWSGDADFLLDYLGSETLIEPRANSLPDDLNFTANFVPETYNIQLRTEGIGTVDIYLSNGDSYDKTSSEILTIDSQTEMTLEAFSVFGWDFTSWSGLPDISELLDPVASIDPSSSLCYFHPSKDLNITAIFEVKEYDDQQIVVNAGTGGDVFLETEENGNFFHFSSYSLNATPQKGYEFSQWITEPTKENSLSNGINIANNTLTIGGEIEINATFSTVVFDLSINTGEGGTISGPSTFTVLDDTPLIQATPNDGWNFSHWSGDTDYLSDANAQFTTINHSSLELKSLSVTANFVREIYQVTLNREGSGSFEIFKDNTPYVSGSTSEIVPIDSATRIGINALPISGWKFAQWFGLPNPNDLRDSSPSLNQYSANINFVPVEDSNLTAQFVRQKYALNIPTPEIGGSTTTGGIFAFESIVEINASAQDHFLFEEWVGDTNQLLYSSTLPNNKIIIPDSNLTIQAIFKPKTYTLETIPNEDGYFEISGTYNDVTLANQSEYNATSSIVVTALPNNPDTHMLNSLSWENSLGESEDLYSPILTIPFLDANYTFEANFGPRNDIGYSLFSSPADGGTAATINEYSSAEVQRIIADPNDGYSFLGWSSETVNSFSPHWAVHSVDTALEENDNVWANFSPKSHFISLNYDNIKGTISGFSNVVQHRDRLNLTATPNENYAFVGWELIKEINLEVTKDQSSVDPLFSRIYVNSTESPELSLIRGFTYYFDCNLSIGDEFFISTSPNGEESEKYYLAGITGHKTSSGILTFEVPMDAPSTLYYHSTTHGYSGNRILISTISDSTLLNDIDSTSFNDEITHSFGLKAIFERTRHTIDIGFLGEGTVNHPNQDFYFWGDTITISATPKEHWYFSHWEGDAEIEDFNSTNTKLTLRKDTAIRAIFKKVQYMVEVNAMPENYGIVVPPETFAYGEYVTLKATPKIGKQFDEWDVLENLSSDNNDEKFNKTASFKVLGNAKAHAKFSKIPLKLDVEIVVTDQNNKIIEGDNGGSINIPSSIFHGDSVNLDITLLPGYDLLHWVDLETDLIISSQKNISYTAITDRNLRVLLRKIHYNLEMSQSDGGVTSINTDLPFYWRDQIEISATPDDHWEFFRWNGIGSENLNNKYSPQAVLSIEKNSVLQAEFKQKEYSLIVSENPEGYGGFSNTENYYKFGDIVTIHANPRKGKLFEEWILDKNASFTLDTNSTSNPASFIIHGNSNILANFESKEYSVIPNVLVVDETGKIRKNVTGGRILGGTRFKDEDIAEFSISLNRGFKLLHWQIENADPNLKPTDLTFKHLMLEDINISAIVTDRKYEIDLSITPLASGTATLNEYIISHNLAQGGFSYNQDISLTASPNEEYRFVKWSSTGTNFSSPNQGNQNFKVRNDVTLTAHFAPTGRINLTLLSSPSDAATDMLGGGSFYYDPEHAILTSAKPGYLFSHWEYNGSIAEGIVRDANSSTTSMILDGDKVLTAVFIEDPNPIDPQDDTSIKYLLSVYSNNAKQGTTKGSGFFFSGTRTIKAFPNSGFIFSHWEGDTPFDPHSPITEISVLANTSVVAHFKSSEVIIEPDEPDEELFQLIVSSNNLNHGTAKGSGFFPKSVRTIEAIPNTGYEFSHWEGSTFANEYSPITDVDVFAYTKVVAHFQSIGLFDDSEALENGWWVNPWFGYFWKVGEDDWLFHEKLGWIFLKKQGDRSIWIWIQKMNGWFWTAKDHYPYLHSESSQSWYWLNLDKSDFNRLVIYDYANTKWFSF